MVNMIFGWSAMRWCIGKKKNLSRSGRILRPSTDTAILKRLIRHLRVFMVHLVHLEFRPFSFFRFVSTCAAQTVRSGRRQLNAWQPTRPFRWEQPGDRRISKETLKSQLNSLPEWSFLSSWSNKVELMTNMSHQRGFGLRFCASNGKFELLLVFVFAVMTITVGKLAFQGLRDESSSIHRLVGLHFSITLHWMTVKHTVNRRNYTFSSLELKLTVIASSFSKKVQV